MSAGITGQLDLFSEVLHAYSAEREGTLDNATLYAEVARRAGLPPEALSERVPVGESRQPHNLMARRVRWLSILFSLLMGLVIY